ncbi:methyltransferase domain-containing protein [Roseovarius sp. E0-M6]|uniref:methyltransferase domain-containing protein n=1 Tax=Roseovarius sp. E0-M6 TaxID=3127118 RepID=UPI00300FB79F
MSDPFQDVDAAGPEFIAMFADAMDARQSDPTMERIVAAYLGMLEFRADGLTVEIGAGAGAVTRRIADAAAPGRVIGHDPSAGFIAEARARAGNRPNLDFEVADGTALPHDDASADNTVLHTVLTHVTDPSALLAEAARILRPGGRVVVCDMDFSKASLAGFRNDPLQACAGAFIDTCVTDPYVVSKLKRLAQDAGLVTEAFHISNRLVTDGPGMLPWVQVTTQKMVERDEIGSALADALVEEYDRRSAHGLLQGFQPVATLVARKPA